MLPEQCYAVMSVPPGDLRSSFACVAFVLLAVMSLRFAKREPTPAG
jgi:hypothetical protein